MRTSLLLIASAAMLAACSSTDTASSAAATGGTVVVDSPGDAVDLFPPFVADQTGRWVSDQLFERLADIDLALTTTGDKGFTPRLAQKWTWAPDSMSIAFSINPRARWHDGKPVTASDVRYSFKTFVDPKVASPSATLFANIDSISVRDSLTAVAWFKKHKPEQFYDLAYNLLVFPEHVYGAIAPADLHTSEAMRKPVGSGRFRFVRWDPGTRIELISDTANYRGRAKLDRVIFTPADPPTGATQVLAGQADYLEAFPIDQAPRLDSSKVARGFSMPQRGYVFLAMNSHAPKSKTEPHPIFGDIRVRRALSMAADRAAMLRNVFGDKGRLSHGPFPMNLGYADSTLKLPSYDTTAAKAMLDSSGWRAGSDGIRAKAGRPLRFSIIMPTASLFRRRYGVLLQEQFRKIGAQVDVEPVDPPTMLARLNEGSFDAALASPSPDPSPTGAKQTWGTSGIGPTGANFLLYSNKKVDALLDSAGGAFDAAKSKQYASRAMQTIVDDVPGIWLYDIVIVDAANRRLNIPKPTGDGWWMDLADWTIPADKRIDRDRIGLTQAKP